MNGLTLLDAQKYKFKLKQKKTKKKLCKFQKLKLYKNSLETMKRTFYVPKDFKLPFLTKT